MCLSSEVFLRHPKNFKNVKDKSLSVTIASVVLRALPGVFAINLAIGVELAGFLFLAVVASLREPVGVVLSVSQESRRTRALASSSSSSIFCFETPAFLSPIFINLSVALKGNC